MPCFSKNGKNVKMNNYASIFETFIIITIYFFYMIFAIQKNSDSDTVY